jgi:regulator of protease activity HflC (stomatin/prohibitin superfamily)
MDLLPLQGALTFTAVGLLFLFVVVAVIWQAVEVVPAYEKRVLTVFGEYRTLLEPGLNIVPPFVSRTYPFDMRTQTLDIPQIEAMTWNNSTVTADVVVEFTLVDPKQAFHEVKDHVRSLSTHTQSTLRAVVEEMKLDNVLTNRQEITAKIRTELDDSSDKWGVRIENVEVREIHSD